MKIELKQHEQEIYELKAMKLQQLHQKLNEQRGVIGQILSEIDKTNANFDEITGEIVLKSNKDDTLTWQLTADAQYLEVKDG